MIMQIVNIKVKRFTVKEQFLWPKKNEIGGYAQLWE